MLTLQVTLISVNEKMKLKKLFRVKCKDNKMKVNSDKYHLIINRNNQMEIEVENEHVKSKK